MGVEILIVSGARRNERIALDCRAFQAGGDPNCEVFFDPRHDPAVKGRSAKFRLQEGGWYVRSSGGDMWVGTQRIAGATHVRSGDVIRMSMAGPEFFFYIVADAKASPGNAPGDEIASPLTSAEEAGGVGASQGEPGASGLSLADAAALPAGRQTATGELPTLKAREPAMARLGRRRSGGRHPGVDRRSGGVLSVADQHHGQSARRADAADYDGTRCQLRASVSRD